MKTAVPYGGVMKKVWKWALPLLLAVLMLFLWLNSGPGFGVGSSLSSASSGWSAIRHYLAARDTAVELLDQPLARVQQTGTWVLSFPWSEPLDDEDLAAISGHLRDGGDLLLAYSGENAHLEETLILQELDLGLTKVGSDPPLVPWQWWQHRNEIWELTSESQSSELQSSELQSSELQSSELQPSQGDTIVRRLAMPAVRWAPEAASASQVFYRRSRGETPLIFEVERQRGRVIFVPRQVLSNGRLGTADNLELAEELRGRLQGPWRFDEYHHGWKRLSGEAFSSASQAWDMFVIHLLVIYGLAVLALIRRFGPAWKQQVLATGSAAEFLRGVGSLHDRLGHHGEAARWMLQRAEDVDPQRDWQGVDIDVQDGPGLVALGQEISRRQRRRKS